MTLEKWLKLVNMKPYHFAKSAKLGVATIHELLHGGTPSLPTIRKIEKATEGAVTANDWKLK